MGKFLAFILAIGGALAASQGPGFSLQYMQNLSGRVDELAPIVAQFDTDVAKYGYTRRNALNECAAATGLLDALCDGYAATIARYEDLSAHLAELQAASDLMRPLTLARTYKRDIIDSVLETYKPAVPTTMDGGLWAGGGFLVSWLVSSLVFGFLGLPFRRRSKPDGRWA